MNTNGQNKGSTNQGKKRRGTQRSQTWTIASCTTSVSICQRTNAPNNSKADAKITTFSTTTKKKTTFFQKKGKNKKKRRKLKGNTIIYIANKRNKDKRERGKQGKGEKENRCQKEGKEGGNKAERLFCFSSKVPQKQIFVRFILFVRLKIAIFASNTSF